MQVQQFRITAVWLLILIGAASIISFTSPSGADSYQVYLNNKLVIQEYVTTTSGPKSLQLDKNDYNGEIEAAYNHCGTPGRNRKITITDLSNHVLNEWKFGDGKDIKSLMS